MSPQQLPSFKYHPDPIATGSVMPSPSECVCCGQARGHVYTGPVYARGEYRDRICPWCIADGSAHLKLGASFQDDSQVGGGGKWEEVSRATVEEVIWRTPGFGGWQQERWWTHCGDAAQFIGRAGRAELTGMGAPAVEAIRASTGMKAGPEWDSFMAALDAECSPRAYLFRCGHCGKIGGYVDCD
jgi:uncharacterized protein CbrC (UPF0167 family)